MRGKPEDPPAYSIQSVLALRSVLVKVGGMGEGGCYEH